MGARRGCWQSLLLALSLAGSAAAASQPMVWEHDLEAAKKTAARTGRLVLVHSARPGASRVSSSSATSSHNPVLAKS